MSNTLIYTRPVDSSDKHITVLAFRKRFTLEERVAMEKRAREDAMIRVFMYDINAATYIDLEDPDLRTCLEAAAMLDVIEVGRVEEILAAPVQQQELPE